MKKTGSSSDWKLGILLLYTVLVFSALVYIYKGSAVRLFLVLFMLCSIAVFIVSHQKGGALSRKRALFFLSAIFLLGFLADSDVFPNVTRIIDGYGEKEIYLSENIFYVGIIICMSYLLFIFLYNEIKGLNIKSFFLITAIPTLIMIFLLMPHGFCPDSKSHILSSYRYSNVILGIPEEQEWCGREEDVEYFSYLLQDGAKVNSTRESISWALTNWGDRIENDTLTDFSLHEDYMKFYSVFCYLPQVLGITIARLLGLSSAMTFGLGRIFMGIAYVLGCYRAICKTPRYKGFLAFVALIPEALTLGISYSYDAMLLVVSLNFVAGILRLADDSGNKFVLVEQLIWTFLLGAVKSGAYLLLLPIVFAVSGENKKQKWMKVFSILGIAILSVVLFDIVIPDGRLFQLGGQNQEKLSAAFAWTHPISYGRMLLMTYFRKTDEIFWSGLGDHIGWWETLLPHILLGTMAVLWILLIRRQHDTVACEKKLRICSVISVGLVLIVTPAMLLSWTAVGSSIVEGLQGRYYLPMVPVLLMTFQYKDANSKENGKTWLYYGLAYLYVLCICYMMGMYLGR